MSIKQLFTKSPTDDIILKIINCFGLTDINDNTEFSQIDMNQQNTLVKFNNLKSELEEYYLPCKRNIYLKNINYKSIITITRQFLKTIDYTLDSREKYIKSKKYLIYKLITLFEKQNKLKNKVVVSFN